MDRAGLDALLELLHQRGYETVGPVLHNGAITYDVLADTADLPIGWGDTQDGGHYRLRQRDDQALFGYAAGPQSWKKYLFPPVETLYTARRDEQGIQFEPAPVAAPKRAFFGVRACELHAIAIQDRVFIGGPYPDPGYQARRDNVFIVALNCGQAGGTCFCVSMGTGPKADQGFDLALTEVLADDGHYFLLETGSPRGEALIDQLPARPAQPAELAAAQAVVARTAASMGRSLETRDIKELLYDNLEHPRWDEVAERCLSCANCTLACPTCFCSTGEEVTDLADTTAEHRRVWDSCFNLEFSHLAGGSSVRRSTRGRYRQWMTHKLASWHDQFDSSGCVGCGRCITWCPVGIDITEEAAAIRATDSRRQGP